MDRIDGDILTKSIFRRIHWIGTTRRLSATESYPSYSSWSQKTLESSNILPGPCSKGSSYLSIHPGPKIEPAVLISSLAWIALRNMALFR
jgi:hypothetical protein